jgi:hypothetical protein
VAAAAAERRGTVRRFVAVSRRLEQLAVLRIVSRPAERTLGIETAAGPQCSHGSALCRHPRQLEAPLVNPNLRVGRSDDGDTPPSIACGAAIANGANRARGTTPTTAAPTDGTAVIAGLGQLHPSYSTGFVAPPHVLPLLQVVQLGLEGHAGLGWLHASRPLVGFHADLAV